MSHRTPAYNTQSSGSRSRDATVARAVKSQTSKQNDGKTPTTRLGGGTMSQLSPPANDLPGTSDRRARLKSSRVPTTSVRSPSLKSTAIPKTISSSTAPSKSTLAYGSTSQEVPLVMDSASYAWESNADANLRRPVRPSDLSRHGRSPLDSHLEAIFGTASTRQVDLPPRLIPELQALAASSARQHDYYTKSSSSISSPSTQFSNTPSPWSVSTATTTPTSWSSTSPGIVQQVTMKTSNQRSQTVPFPATKREKLPKMPALPETYSSIPPSQSSTSVQDKSLKKSSSKKRTPLNSPAPTPPPRTSSAKQALSRSSSSKSDKKAPRYNAEPTTSSSDLDQTTLATHGNLDPHIFGDYPLQSSVTRAHNELQHSLGVAPPRPSRQGVMGLEDSRPITVNTHRAGFSNRHREILDLGEEAALQAPEPMQRSNHSMPVLRPTTPGESEIQIQSSPSRLGKFSRLGIFSRRGKSPANETEKSPRKLQRRGPVAGTGHEGYGKYGRRGRKTSQDGPSASSSANNSESERSVSSTRRIPLGTSQRKDSQTSNRPKRGSQSDIDEFAVPRLKPVTMMGGSGGNLSNNSESHLETHPTNANASSSAVHMRSDTPSQSQISVERHALDFEPSPISRIPKREGKIPSLAVRRSQRFHGETDNFNLPTPIRTEALSAALYADNHDTPQSSAIAGSASTPSTATEHNRIETNNKSTDKKSRKHRWNIFRRKDVPEPGPERYVPVPSSASPEELSVSVSTIPMSRPPMPYYAMMDSESEIYTSGNVGEFLSEVVESPSTSPYVGTLGQDEDEIRRWEEEVLIPVAPVSPLRSFERSPPPVPLKSPTAQVHVQMDEKPQKQPRLARVGRIPPVISRQERQHKPSRASFSQPFARPVIPDSPDMQPDASVSNLAIPMQSETDTSPHEPLSAFGLGSGETEFLRFPSRQGSELSSSSTSEGTSTMLRPTLMPGLPENQAPYRPGVYEPSSPSLDEVWNEYDDFIDHVMSPSQVRKSNRFLATQEGLQDYSKPTGLTLPTKALPLSKKGKEIKTAAQSNHELKRTVFMPALVTSATPPVVFPAPTLSERSVGEDIRLRRSRIALALHSSMEPISPFSIRDLISEYGSYQRESGGFSERLSSSTAGQSTEQLTQSTSNTEIPPEHNHQENVALLDVIERGKDPAAQSELHYASLMVAKWLSFGRVLFSPAHDEIERQTERHVLVIDGLGNEDWSIYCAVTYEDHKAFIHNLKERMTGKASKDSKAPTNAPNNHRRAEVASFYEKFPFPPGFFSAVVLRFPPAMAEAKMKNIIAESRRVLLPGGYLELMLLDLDIVNMGVQTRRAVRELKFKMTTADQQISLRPIIDNVQGVLGARGFSNISRCVVGVPVAGRPNGSVDSSSSSRSSKGSDGITNRGSGDLRAANASPRMAFGGRRGHNLSLNDLIADHSDNADAKISKIVSTTARRWWQHCFEAAVISDGNLATSIFADKTVLSECKARGSSFKMLIAYAQRPNLDNSSVRRRTMSEPTVSTMATIGSHRSPPSTYPGARTPR